jgi:hypothetical protein
MIYHNISPNPRKETTPRSKLVLQPSLCLQLDELLQSLLERHNLASLLRRRVVTVPHVHRSVLLLLGTKNYISVNIYCKKEERMEMNVIPKM